MLLIVISFPPNIDVFSGSAEVSGVLHLQWIAMGNGPTRPHVTALAMYCTPDIVTVSLTPNAVPLTCGVRSAPSGEAARYADYTSTNI
jgi:hypothetical protein